MDFQLSSLFRWAWTFAEIALEGPRLDAALGPDGRLNLADLLDSMPRGEPAEPAPPTATPRVLLQHAVVRRGVVSFTDLSGRKPQTVALEPIDVELRNITTIPERRGPYGHLIWQALVTVITKIATSPFRALGALLGGEGEGLDTIAFEPGRDTVRPPERQKLRRVAVVLGKRPRLKLTVHGGYEAAVDGEALRALRVRQDLARELDQAKTQRALEALLTERAGEAAVAEFQADDEKRTGKTAQRVNPVLALVGRGSPDREFYEGLLERLVETAPLSEAEVTALASRKVRCAIAAR